VKILLIEDYEPLRKSLTKGLREAGYCVETAEEGEQGLWLAETCRYDLVVLDLMLPGIDGLTILKRLRKAGKAVHVLILTAKDTIGDRVKGLDLGADDYLVKPFAFEELLARVRALLRRNYGTKSAVVKVGDLEVDTVARGVSRAGSVIELTAKEYNLIEYLVLRAGQVVTRVEIWESLYDFAAEPNSNVIDVYISSLRKKLEQGGMCRLIHTRRGLGYVLKEPA
jgi:DNA-binding response OmpR family regulator